MALEALGLLFEKLLVKLAMLSFRMMLLALTLMGRSPRLVNMPGNGRSSFVHTSVRECSRRMRSLRRGARIGTFLVVARTD
jgi:hypothetical protein